MKYSENIKAYLKQGEEVRWLGKPSQTFFLPDSLNILAIIFVGTSFYGFLLRDIELIFLIIAVNIIGFTIFLIADQFYRRKVYFAVTNQRIILVSWFLIKAININEIQDISKKEYRNGIGNLIFKGTGPNYRLEWFSFSKILGFPRYYFPLTYGFMIGNFIVFEYVSGIKKVVNIINDNVRAG